MKKKLLMGAILIVATIGCVSLGSQPVLANGFSDEINAGLQQINGGSNQASASDIVKKIINGLLFLIGIIAVIMIIYGGIRYTTSAGDSTKIAAAKNTILYAVVGLIVAIMAYAIVNFVVSSFNGGSGNGGSSTTTSTGGEAQKGQKSSDGGQSSTTPSSQTGGNSSNKDVE